MGMQFNSSQRTLLECLSDGRCHSGNELGQALGITRSGIWKQINHLIEFGIPIHRIPHQGYQLEHPMTLLEEGLISSQLISEGLRASFKVHLFSSIDSTNRYLKELPINPGVDICCAEQQTQGRGRFGRPWHSPFGENIYCSSRWSLNSDLSRLSGLSLVASLALLATIQEFTPSPDIKIKWPNDILWGDKKLSGTLIEIIAESNGTAQIIIGIGLNVNSDTQKHPLPDKAWCSLYEIAGHQFNRNQIVSRLIINLKEYLDRFFTHDLNAFMDEWNASDYLLGKQVTVSQSTGIVTGVAKGISVLGQLIIEDNTKKLHYLASGDATLKTD